MFISTFLQELHITMMFLAHYLFNFHPQTVIKYEFWSGLPPSQFPARISAGKLSLSQSCVCFTLWAGDRNLVGRLTKGCLTSCHLIIDPHLLTFCSALSIHFKSLLTAVNFGKTYSPMHTSHTIKPDTHVRTKCVHVWMGLQTCAVPSANGSHTVHHDL